MAIESISVGQSRHTTFGELMRQHRARIGLTQQELSDLSLVSVRAIRDLERGRATRPRSETATMIAQALRLGPRARTALLDAGRPIHGWLLRAEAEAAALAPPRPAQPLLGRAAATATLCAELAGEERLVTVTGVAGSGKSRLAAQVADRLYAEAGIPVLWFSFSAPAGGGRGDAVADVLRGCAAALFGRNGFDDADRGRRAAAQPLAELAALARDAPALLVLDDVADRTPRQDVLARMLEECRHLRTLTTADAPLGASGERVFMLGGVGEDGGPAAHGDDPRVQIFLDAARRAGLPRFDSQPDLTLIREICRLLDALPAALRGAASWLAVYDVAQLHRCLAADPGTLLKHASGIAGDSRLADGLRRCVRALPDRCAALAVRLAHLPRGTRFGLAQVAALADCELPQAAQLARELVVRGAIRADGAGGQFSMLNLVRAVVLADQGS